MNKNKSIRRLKNSGAAIPMVLLAVAVLLVMGTGLLGLSMHSRTFATRNASQLVVRCAVDAALVKTIFEMNEKLKADLWDNSTLPQVTDEALPNCDATFSYTVTGSPADGFAVEAIGKSGSAVRRASCALPLKGPFETAFFAQENVNLKSSATVDWYNYDADDRTFQVGTNSTLTGAVDLKNGITINGDVVVGAGGDPDVVIDGKSGANIAGSTYALTEEYEFMLVTVPQDLQGLPSNGPINDNETITGSGKYSEIDLGNGETIVIKGAVNLYVIGDVVLGNSAQLQVDDTTNPNAALTLYIGGSFEGKNNSDINNMTTDPKKLKIYGLDSCRNIDIKNNSSFYGAIYAPNADVVLHNGIDMYGSVVARNIEQKNSADFNYDASLRDVDISDEAVSFTVKEWSEQ